MASDSPPPSPSTHLSKLIKVTFVSGSDVKPYQVGYPLTIDSVQQLFQRLVNNDDISSDQLGKRYQLRIGDRYMILSYNLLFNLPCSDQFRHPMLEHEFPGLNDVITDGSILEMKPNREQICIRFSDYKVFPLEYGPVTKDGVMKLCEFVDNNFPKPPYGDALAVDIQGIIISKESLETNGDTILEKLNNIDFASCEHGFISAQVHHIVPLFPENDEM